MKLIKKVKDLFLELCEVYAAKLSNWSWRKRWQKKTGTARKKIDT
jgi:hypothetical protein